jgi:L-lactate dehydrogenase complex protein LldE
MITCLGDMFFPEVGVAIVKLLRGLGVTVDFPDGQTCCGMPLFNSGYHGEAAQVAARTVDLFARSEHVVVPSGSCAWMVKEEYPGLLKDDPRRGVESSFRGKVTYHDSCHLLRGLGESRAPRALLQGVEGVELLELPGADECCGFGGSFSVRLPEVSTAILGKKLDNVEKTGADCLVACDGGCLMQMSGGLSRRNSRVRALHLAQVLAGDGA